jgi:hypothetical protein
MCLYVCISLGISVVLSRANPAAWITPCCMQQTALSRSDHWLAAHRLRSRQHITQQTYDELPPRRKAR